MSTNDGGELTVEEAAEHLRDLRDNLGEDQLQEAFETGGGLMDHEENQLQSAIDLMGEARVAEILGVDVPEGGLPGEQVTLAGEPERARVPEERAEPVPEDTASLAEFTRDDEDADADDTLTCRSFQAMLERQLAVARRSGELFFQEFTQPLNRAEDRGCITELDADRLRRLAGRAEPEVSTRDIDTLFDVVSEAFAAGGPGNG